MSNSLEKFYEHVETIGQGAQATVHLVKRKDNQNLSVIKQMDLSLMDEKGVKLCYKEAQILKILKHPNIIKLQEVYKTKRGHLHIVMEHADDGDLMSHIQERKSSGKYFSEDEVLNIFTQIGLALKHAHDRKILHRDLKPSNVFMMKGGMVKLGDFGVAGVIEHTKSYKDTFLGTPLYMCPEMLKQERYDTKSDIWSLGVVLYELCALRLPFEGGNISEIVKAVVVQEGYKEIPSDYSDDIKKLIKKMLSKEPSKRPNINSIVRYPLIEQRAKVFLGDEMFEQEFSQSGISG